MKYFLTFIALIFLNFLFGQDLKFEPSDLEPVGGMPLQTIKINDTIFYTSKIKSGVGMINHIHRYNNITGKIESIRIDDLKKKDLWSIDDAINLRPVMINDVLFSLVTSEDQKEIILKGRKFPSLEYNGENHVIFTSEESIFKLSDWKIVQNTNFFGLYKSSAFLGIILF